MLIQSQYLSGDFAGASKELMAEISAAERAGQAPPEDRLKLLLNAATKQGDNNAYVFAMEKLVTYYPKKEYWVDLLSRMQRKPSFSDRLALDAFRLSLATGSMTKPADFMEMAQLALQADLPSESKQVVDKGFASNVLGTGPRPSGTSACAISSPSGSPRTPRHAARTRPTPWRRSRATRCWPSGMKPGPTAVRPPRACS
jgi:hypothetical protein